MRPARIVLSSTPTRVTLEIKPSGQISLLGFGLSLYKYEKYSKQELDESLYIPRDVERVKTRIQERSFNLEIQEDEDLIGICPNGISELKELSYVDEP